MSDRLNPELQWRALLTETLPYEVPVIFSNDLLFASLAKPSSDEEVSKIIASLRAKLSRFTIPYTYKITKDERRFTTLSIIHPNQQININNFYEFYSQSILDYCNRSEATLRRPLSEMAVFSANPLDDEQSHRQGVPHILPEDGEIDVSRMTSYFSYGRYNLLGKFIDSNEYRQLEKKFNVLRTVDITKCFFNIYTHSVTWSVKGKEFSKSQSEVYSFESAFDKLMQCSNYNETNGIVVGPEISRLFAEIILQDIDRRLIRRMHPLVHGVDFAIRRYVDDFFIFAPSQIRLDTITSALEVELEGYKLFINNEKTETLSRPFVSSITLARSELKALIAGMHGCMDTISANRDVSSIRRAAADLRRLALDIRLISKRHGVSFSAISAWLLATLRSLLKRASGLIVATPGDEERAALTDMAVTILEIAFYVGALDPRVRTTYSLCQIVGVIDALAKPQLTDVTDRLFHSVGEELSSMITALLRSNLDEAPLLAGQPLFPLRTDTDQLDDSVELYNLMIIGAHFLGVDFLKLPAMREALRIISAKPPTYFRYITIKFCLLKDRSSYDAELQALNQSVKSFLLAAKDKLGLDTEVYLLACDYLSAPDVTPAEKRTMLAGLLGGTPSNAGSETTGQYVGFVDWTGVRISHVLARKQLRPVYSWS